MKAKNIILNCIGIAMLAMLVGSNVEYALENYGLLVHNLSYADLSETEMFITDLDEGTDDRNMDSDCYGLTYRGWGFYYSLEFVECRVEVREKATGIILHSRESLRKACRHVRCDDYDFCYTNEESECSL